MAQASLNDFTLHQLGLSVENDVKACTSSTCRERWKDGLPAVESRGSKETLFFASSLHLTDSFTDLVIFESKLLLNFLLWTSHLGPIFNIYPWFLPQTKFPPWTFHGPVASMALLLGAQSGFGARTTRFQDHHFLSGENTSHHTTNVVVSWVAVQQGVTCWVFVSKDSQQKKYIQQCLAGGLITASSFIFLQFDIERMSQRHINYFSRKTRIKNQQTPYTNVSHRWSHFPFTKLEGS